MMVLKRIRLLLFVFFTGTVSSSNEVLITVPKATDTANEGSCVTIPCDYKKTNADCTYTLLWFKDPNYDHKLQMFNGTIVYSNTKERPQSPGFSSRVSFMQHGNQKGDWIKCDLRITDLQKTDSGNYSFRTICSTKKYMSSHLNLTVKDNPCKVHIDSSELKNPLSESDEFTLRCSTSGSCDLYPEWLIHTSEQKQKWTSTLSTDMITEEKEEGRKVTELKLNVTWKDDNRTLSCRPGKSEDSWQIRNITLSVEHAPKETKATVSSAVVKEGDSVTLSCTSRGRPDVSFTWFKKEKIEKSQKSDLELINVKPEDSGEYYCEAENKHGTEKSNIIQIDVKYGPQGVTVQHSANINDLKEGDKLTLKCLVQKSNPAVYQFTWYKNSQDQHEASQTFIISNVTAEDRGSYHCEASNGLKRAKSDELNITVMYSPRNIKIEGTTSVKVGTTLTLTCSAESNPLPHMYTWKHTPGLSSFSLSMNNEELKIDEVTIQHAGQYTCDVTNDIGTRSNTTKVDVLYPPSNLSLIMKGKVREFDMISIICTVQSFPKSQLTVTGPQGNLSNIQENRRKSTASANTLSVYLNVTESDAGMYSCIADNKEGKNETKQQLTVLHVPKNVTASITGKQTSGSKLTLACTARANPPLSLFEWKKRFNGAKNTVGNKKELQFNSLKISDSGQYVCIAENTIGKTESPSVEIKVKYAPNINIVHNMTTSTWEFPVHLTCSADAYPLATVFKWYREEDNKTVLSHEQNFTVQPQDPGMYYCTAENDIGKSRSKNIMLFISSNSLKVFYQTILPIILLLILIVVAIFLIRRTIIKGSRNNTQDNLSAERIPDSSYGRVNQAHSAPHSQDPTQAQDLNPRPKSNVHTVYAAIKLPQMKQGKKSPKPHKTAYMDNDATTSTLNYVTLDFKGQNKPEERVPESSTVYAVVSKNKQTRNSQSDHDYENVSSACVPKVPFTNMDWESDTSEEDEEVNYTTVSCSAKSAVKQPKQNQKSRLSSSSSDEDDRTAYTDIKT